MARLMGIPPTGRTVEMGIMDIARLVDGKVVETWHMGDDLGSSSACFSRPSRPIAESLTFPT
jgi:hypothetical protein